MCAARSVVLCTARTPRSSKDADATGSLFCCRRVIGYFCRLFKSEVGGNIQTIMVGLFTRIKVRYCTLRRGKELPALERTQLGNKKARSRQEIGSSTSNSIIYADEECSQFSFSAPGKVCSLGKPPMSSALQTNSNFVQTMKPLCASRNLFKVTGVFGTSHYFIKKFCWRIMTEFQSVSRQAVAVFVRKTGALLLIRYWESIV